MWKFECAKDWPVEKYIYMYKKKRIRGDKSNHADEENGKDTGGNVDGFRGVKSGI